MKEDLLKWLDKVSRDQEVPQASARIAIVIAANIGPDGGVTMGRAELGQRLGLHPTTLRATLGVMRDRGLVEIQPGCGRGRVGQLRPKMPQAA